LIHVSVRQNRSGWCESAISDKAIECALLSMDLIFSILYTEGMCIVYAHGRINLHISATT